MPWHTATNNNIRIILQDQFARVLTGFRKRKGSVEQVRRCSWVLLGGPYVPMILLQFRIQLLSSKARYAPKLRLF